MPSSFRLNRRQFLRTSVPGFEAVPFVLAFPAGGATTIKCRVSVIA